MTTTTPPPDLRIAQTAATRLVAQALAQMQATATPHDGITIHGEHYTIHGPVRAESRPGQLDGIVSFTVADGTTEEAVLVTLMVAAAPGGGGS